VPPLKGELIMFKIDPRASFGLDTHHEDESDDSISMTSTVSGHDPDQEFVVENILAERQFEDGNMYYLVEWTDFPLHESTWEPESNIGPDLKAIWEEDKAKHATGELKPFDVQRFEDAGEQAAREKAARHWRRNRKRRKLGLEPTEPFEKDSSDEEAVEEDEIEISHSEPAQAARSQNQQKNAKGVSSPGAPVTPVPTPVVGSFQLPNEVRRPRGTELPTESSSGINSKRKQTAPPSPQNTGYQGTARPARKTSADTAPRSRTRPTISIPTSSKPAAPSTRKTLTAKKSTTQPTGNIFTSGKTRKLRPGLKDMMSDPTREPRLFGKHRQIRQVCYFRLCKPPCNHLT
jgi:chromo domain-containing protein 1